MARAIITLKHLDDMDASALRQTWEADVGRPPPARASETYMRSVLAYRIQERAGPKLSAATKRKLERIAKGEAMSADFSSDPRSRLKPGMKLLREWNGVTHEVAVLEKGFDYLGQRYRSLSAIAREITGTRWSGPAFFGVKG